MSLEKKNKESSSWSVLLFSPVGILRFILGSACLLIFCSASQEFLLYLFIYDFFVWNFSRCHLDLVVKCLLITNAQLATKTRKQTKGLCKKSRVADYHTLCLYTKTQRHLTMSLKSKGPEIYNILFLNTYM